MVNYLGVIQARISSSRLPGKVMLDLAGKTLLASVIECARKAKLLDEIVVVTSRDERDDVIAYACESLAVKVYRGELDDVLSRFLAVAEIYSAKNLVRITADNPLTFPEWIDQLIVYYEAQQLSYSCCEGLPYGSTAEVFSREILRDMQRSYEDTLSREHVTYYMKLHARAQKCSTQFNYQTFRTTVDTLEDYAYINRYFWQCKHKKIEPLSLKHFIAYAELLRR